MKKEEIIIFIERVNHFRDFSSNYLLSYLKAMYHNRTILPIQCYFEKKILLMQLECPLPKKYEWFSQQQVHPKNSQPFPTIFSSVKQKQFVIQNFCKLSFASKSTLHQLSVYKSIYSIPEIIQQYFNDLTFANILTQLLKQWMLFRQFFSCFCMLL